MHKVNTTHAVAQALAYYFEVHPALVAAHHGLQDDWGLDAHELELIAMQIEEELGVQLDSYAALAEVHTVAQLVQLFRAQARRSRWLESSAEHAAG
jgi:hypothetical protein